MSKDIVVGTRASRLAQWQAHWVVNNLKKFFPKHKFIVVEVKTQGDKNSNIALTQFGTKGVFTKELETAILERRIDFAVHSMKDLPTRLPDGLTIGAICERSDPADVLISRQGLSLEELPLNARIGTSSLRRRAQLKHFRSDLQIENLRGNLNTRMAKLKKQNLDGIVLAAAGIERLGWGNRITQRVPYSISLPAVGQGAIGIEIRENDREILEIVKVLEHAPSAITISAERSFLRTLEGGCQIPIGAIATLEGKALVLEGMVGNLNGVKILRAKLDGTADQAEQIGIYLANKLLNMGADKILNELKLRFNRYE